MKRLALYPFLFVLYIIVTPLANNIGQLDPSQALGPLLGMWLAAFAGLILFYVVFRNWQYASYLVMLAFLLFFGFSYLNRTVQGLLAYFMRAVDEEILLGIWGGFLGVLAIKKVWERLGNRTWFVGYMNILMVLWLLFPTYELLTGSVLKAVQAKEDTALPTWSAGEITLDCSTTPDIYYIILDGYGRADMLSELYGLDNQPFLAYLQDQGFYIATKSSTNYIQTIFSIPSSLNFDFIDPPGEGIAGEVYFSDLMINNEIMGVLKHCGYRTVAIESGYFFTAHPEVDLYLEQGVSYNEFESLLLVDSPVDALADELDLDESELSYEAHRQRVLYSFEMLKKLPELSGPKFIFAHIISPHPPFIFDQSGQTVEPNRPYYIGDGDDFIGSLDEYLTGYPQQVQFVNQEMMKVIDSILAQSDSPPIIIVQGDHGPGSRLVWDSPEKTCMWERTPILNAYYLPGAGENWLYPSISPVNTFRVVLNAYFGTDLPLLRDTTYFTSHRLERQAIDITAIRTSKDNCFPP
jgi:hypothetical protein